MNVMTLTKAPRPSLILVALTALALAAISLGLMGLRSGLAQSPAARSPATALTPRLRKVSPASRCPVQMRAEATRRCALHIVQLGDSVASGEGTLYGYHYDPSSGTWKGGNLDVKWPGRYPWCHDSPYAYGQLVARALKASFYQFACSGADFHAGIAGPEPLGNGKTRPPQFGAGPAHATAAYAIAKPNIVLVTIGANDVGLSQTATYCILHTDQNQCTRKNPGPAVKHGFLPRLWKLPAELRILARWLLERGGLSHPRLVPRIVFTNYFNPFPPHGRTCVDAFYTRPQIRYLSSLQHRLSQTIAKAIRRVAQRHHKVSFVNLENAFAGHTWCTRDPWVYGVSIGIDSFGQSRAPFHPTPAGQRRIAGLVLAALR